MPLPKRFGTQISLLKLIKKCYVIIQMIKQILLNSLIIFINEINFLINMGFKFINVVFNPNGTYHAFFITVATCLHFWHGFDGTK